MKGFSCKKLIAGLLSAVTLCGAATTASAASFSNNADIAAKASSDQSVIINTSFEDASDLSSFTGRGGVEQLSQSSEYAYTGDYSMCISGREKSWNGPQFLMDDVSQPNTEYFVSAAIRTPWYANVTLSWEYTDTAGERHFNNLGSAVSNGDWAVFEDIKFSYTSDMTKVYIYAECSDAGATLYVDDFSVETAPVIPIQEDIPSLKDVYNDYFDIGTAIMASNLSSPSFMNLVKKHFSESITAGNEMKPENLLDKNACLAMAADGDDTNPQVTLSVAASLLNYCRDTGTPMRGHVLVWHSQTPDWFFKENYDESADWVSKDKMLLRMENYIKNVFAALEEQYPDVNIYAWDVVNEAWLDNGSPRTGGTQAENPNYSGWVKVFGDNSFIEPAFEYARKYAPEGCKLYYNDFNEYMPDKTKAIVNMANSLKEKGLIDGIGCQSHLDVTFPGITAYEKAIKAFSETGLDIQITELDATTSDTSEAGLETQAKYYSDIMDVLVKYADSISTVVFWGVTDDQSWRASRLPLLFDAEYQAKPCYYSIIDDIEYDEPIVTTTTTVSEPVVTTTTATTPAPTDGNYYVDIEVVDAATGEYIDGAEVSVSSTAWQGSWFTSDENPKTIRVIPLIDYEITLSAPTGYKADDSNITAFTLGEVVGGKITLKVVETAVVDPTTSPTTGPVGNTVYGDADLNGAVEIADVVAIMVHCSTPNGTLSEEAINNADVYQRGDGIGNMDALAVQKRIAQLISELPESYM